MARKDDIRLQALWAWGEVVAQTGCWEHVPSTSEIRWSDNLFRIFGFEPGALAPSEAYVLGAIHPDDRARFDEAIRVVVETGDSQVADQRITRPDGERRYVRATIAVAERRDGRPYRLIGVVQDLTDSRRAEREIAAHVAVEEALADWQELEPGAHELMAHLAVALDCVAGVFWVPLGDVLVPRVFWHGEAVDEASAEAALRAAPLRRGSGLAGRAWEAGQPLADASDGAEDAAVDDGAADRDALSGGLAIPAVDGQQVLAVVELRADRPISLGERLTRSLCGISHELGHFLARRGGELAAPVLTAREIEVLQLAAEGLSARLTAERLTISPATIRTHLENIYMKLGVSDKSSAVAAGMRLGIIN